MTVQPFDAKDVFVTAVFCTDETPNKYNFAYTLNGNDRMGCDLITYSKVSAKSLYVVLMAVMDNHNGVIEDGVYVDKENFSVPLRYEIRTTRNEDFIEEHMRMSHAPNNVKVVYVMDKAGNLPGEEGYDESFQPIVKEPSLC